MDKLGLAIDNEMSFITHFPKCTWPNKNDVIFLTSTSSQLNIELIF